MAQQYVDVMTDDVLEEHARRWAVCLSELSAAVLADLRAMSAVEIRQMMVDLSRNFPTAARMILNQVAEMNRLRLIKKVRDALEMMTPQVVMVIFAERHRTVGLQVSLSTPTDEEEPRCYLLENLDYVDLTASDQELS